MWSTIKSRCTTTSWAKGPLLPVCHLVLGLGSLAGAVPRAALAFAAISHAPCCVDEFPEMAETTAEAGAEAAATALTVASAGCLGAGCCYCGPLLPTIACACASLQREVGTCHAHHLGHRTSRPGISCTWQGQLLCNNRLALGGEHLTKPDGCVPQKRLPSTAGVHLYVCSTWGRKAMQVFSSSRPASMAMLEDHELPTAIVRD